VIGHYLRAGGYHTLARRARVGDAEVDLIVVRDDVVAFVEMKARRDGSDGLEAVTRRKQRQIVKAANAWIAENEAFAGCTIRFDVALVTRDGALEYLDNAFEAGGENGWA
jgi:putative endonuclease